MMILENQKTNQVDFPHYKEHFVQLLHQNYRKKCLTKILIFDENVNF